MGLFAVMLGRRLFSSVFAITERRDMGPSEVPLSMSLFWEGNYNSQLSYVLYYVVVMSSFVRNASPRGHMSFRCLMLCLLGSCELLFYFVLLPIGLEL